MKSLKHLFIVSVAILATITVKAQSDFIELGSSQYETLERLEILLQKDSVLNFSSVKPYDRKTITQRLQYIKALHDAGKISLSRVDIHHINLMLKNNFLWRDDVPKDTTLALKNLWNKSHTNSPFFWGVKRGDFSIYLAPKFNISMGKDNMQTSRLYNNQRMLFDFKGTLTKKLGFYSYASDIQGRYPQYVQNYISKNQAVPGLGYYKDNNNSVDLFEVKGGLMYNASKGIDFQFAFDKLFVGNGYRSLILSDFSQNYMFLKSNFRFWKMNYTTIFAQMVNRRDANGNTILGDTLYPRKFMSFHYLDFQATKWLNLGFYENIVFGRDNGLFDLYYANPFTLLVPMGHTAGSPDKTTVGFNAKANINKSTQLYGQLVINEFVLGELLKYKNGWWANKQAIQLGIKKINLFGVPNLDAQAEVNIVRPFVYAHSSNNSSYTHYNQPLAHPLGSNFKEYIALLKYQPTPKLSLQAKIITWKQGLDSMGVNMGANPINNYRTRPREYGWSIGDGLKSNVLMAHASASYQLLPNCFIDADYIIRNQTIENAPAFNSNIFNVGIRFNMPKRLFEF